MTSKDAPRSLMAVLVGTAPTPARAKLIADTYRKCPYCACYTNAAATVIGVFSMPSDRRWWMEWVADQPEGLLGMTKGEVFFADEIQASSPWSRGEVHAIEERAPCGAACKNCEKYGHECQGCPATRSYRNS
jgi:hypothetical protein